MRYKLTRPVIPKAASSFVFGKNLKQLMITLYVAARVLHKNGSDASLNRHGRRYSLKTAKAQKARNLAGDDTERGSRHEATDRRCGNELDEPAESKKTDAEDNETTNESDGGRDLRMRPLVGVCFRNVLDDLGNRERHDSDGTD